MVFLKRSSAQPPFAARLEREVLLPMGSILWIFPSLPEQPVSGNVGDY